MTIEICDNTTPEMVVAAREAGAVAGKIYPYGMTTNSDQGLRDFFSPSISETFGAMQDQGMLLLLHGELGGERVLVTRREQNFLVIFELLVRKFPRLKIVLEHISTAEAVSTVLRLHDYSGNVAGTFTSHHFCFTLNDVIGDGIRPHHACMPTPKDFDDRDALLEAATSGRPQFFLGSDTAPHRREDKECERGACGVYTAPVLPSVLVEVFERVGRLGRLEDFTSRFGAEFYGLPLNEGTITLERRPWTVPKQIGSVVPFRAGTELEWRLVD
jgi:dihydroorotase